MSDKNFLYFSFYFSLHKTNSKKIGPSSLGIKLLGDAKTSSLKYTDKCLLTLGLLFTVSDKIIKNRKNNK